MPNLRLSGVALVSIVLFTACAEYDKKLPPGGEMCQASGSLTQFTQGIRAEPASPRATERFIVRFRERGEGAGRSLLAESGAQVVLELKEHRAAAIRVAPQAAQALAASGRFEYVEEDPVRMPFAQAIPYGVSMVQAPEAWSGSNPASTKVCVIDSGYSPNHEDLYAANVTGSGSTTWATDTCAHGTHVAGTIAAVDNSVGVVGVMRGSPPLHIVQVFNGADCAWTSASTLIDAVTQCRDAGATVINMSLGGGRASKTEERAFASAFADGVLSIAAAGNDGSTNFAYPASYPAVISVGAVDSNKQVAEFSQKNSQVDLAAPGVKVNSTIPFEAKHQVTHGGVDYKGQHVENAAYTDGVTAVVADGGTCNTASSAWKDKIVLCERGGDTFAVKVGNVRDSGGVAAVIYNNVPGDLAATVGETAIALPAISLSQELGTALRSVSVGTSATVISANLPSNSTYAAMSGTSMASPHVAGVAALVWSHDPTWTAGQVRNALESTAQDLGADGRDDSYGYGLVQAKAAVDALTGNAGQPNQAPTADFSVSCKGLTCTFTDTSTDSDGAVVSRSWAFGDGNSGSDYSVTNAYAAAGAYTVTLTVTDDRGATAEVAKPIEVTPPAAITLTATSEMVGDVRHVHLGWSEITTDTADIYRNGVKVLATDNDGYHDDEVCTADVLRYRLCEANSDRCSPEVSVAL